MKMKDKTKNKALALLALAGVTRIRTNGQNCVYFTEYAYKQLLEILSDGFIKS